MRAAFLPDRGVIRVAGDGARGFFLDVPRALCAIIVAKLNMYKLRANVVVEDLSATLGVLAAWDGSGATKQGLSFSDPRLSALGLRVMLPPHLVATAAAELGAT